MKDKEDQKIEILARERAASKDEYGEEKIPTVLTTSNDKLSPVASDVRVNLGNQIDMVDYNINLIKTVEQVRVDLWLSNNSNKKYL